MTLSTDAQPLAYGVPIHRAEHQRYLDRTRKSWELLNRTRDLIPTGHAGGMWYQMPYPVLLNKGKGSRVWDVDGNEYLDLRIGDWVLIHGHANERINEAVSRQLPLGSQYGSPEWDLSYRMASLLVERMPSVERVRFMVSGTETNLLAMRLARAYSGRAKVAKTEGSYHGHADHTVVGSSTVGISPNKVP